MALRIKSRKNVHLALPLVGALTVFMIFALFIMGSMPRTARADKNRDAQRAPSVVFTNPAAISIPSSGAATPYPSAIVASGLPASLPAAPDAVNVTINSYSHTFPDDVGFVLVGPTGAALNISDGAGDGTDIVNVTYTISDTGATQLPTAGAWAPGTYKPANYYSDVFPAPGPASYQNPGPLGGGTATFSSTFGGTNPNGTWNLYVVDFVGGDTGNIAGGWSLEINPGGPAGCPTAKRPLNFDGPLTGTTDYSVVRNTGGGPSGQITWFNHLSNGTVGGGAATQWGLNGDKFIPGDYDGDGKADIAVWRPATEAYFYILQSSTGTLRFDRFGQTGDDPSVVGDYDGDGKDDPAVYRPGISAGDHSFWYYRSSVNGLIIGTEWGQNGDFPAPGDYDGDGKYDFVVQRNAGGGQAIFYFNLTSAGLTSVIFGTPTDNIVPGYYDADCKTDIAVFRGIDGETHWYILQSSDGSTQHVIHGASATDFSAQGDYNGDGFTDIAIWRPDANPGQSGFHVRNTITGASSFFQWGQNGDLPVATYNRH